MSKWIVEMIDAGCDCCSYIPIGEYDSFREAKIVASGDSNLQIIELKDDEDD